ncbi:alpha/beta fold hydrolase [Pontibacillus yanchengensis]|uniref:Alpha/beta fold hydrolase n=2 Tax=Pontibacillus yanchengensis TaxID=462910 RepID=A0ACC7VL28_9BACI|nr:alpha/beta hydrolase [Pontibacillus yanchengensis]MYL35776.1 alpha/beta fold hydrolase [Pontibacillus yanchengensis]MYL55487.1 alpha/beta fold hydrolase [Pontibacillus yanchengensis]
MKKKLSIGLAVVLLLLVIGLIGAGQYFYSVAISSNSESVDLHGGGESERAVAVSASKEEQEKEEEIRRWTKRQDFEKVDIKSEDDLTLRALYLENEETSNKTVILAHGYKGSNEQMKGITKFYYEQGFNVLKPDARGHGKSEGDYIGYGWHDRLDIEQWVTLLIEEKQAASIYLHGFSMGASTVLMASGQDLPAEVKGIIADSSYTTVKEELSHQLNYLYDLPSFPILDVTSMITKVRAGYSFEEASALKQVGKTEVPIFFIHGAKDELVPTDMAHRLYEAAAGKKTLWIVPGAKHTEGYTVAEEQYKKRLTQFIENVSTN